MINLITGLPGNGKTLFALSYIKALAEKDNRPVFYSGINELKLPWELIDAEKWYEVPPNAIVVIDECQRIFRPRTISKDVPKYVEQLETHRHGGVDLFLITQHPMLADASVRRLTGNHRHVRRVFGTERATIHEWGEARDNCDKPAGRKDSVKHNWKFDKAAYGYYKSAEVHTVKRNIPMRFFVLLAVPVLLIAAAVYVYKFTKKHTEADALPANAAAQLSPAPAANGNKKSSSYQNAKEDAKQYVYENTPRVDGLPFTAPKYDELTAPTVAPAPVACMSTKSRCSCYTQQATPISMPDNLCREIVKNGYFQDFDVAGKSSKDRAPAGGQVASYQPNAVVLNEQGKQATPELPNRPSVVVMPYERPVRVNTPKG
ncbi:zonular occludens toxin domain-containing protein [Undibacterium sp.]|jgi:zona occludens toxin|uniref:zonular occludens toxin domain-containing protein n=1 Tax=Undibacterium sp. TaxID=1914977 RepID=UPI002BD873BB|nr:zonular occludens toxin domain-containing protein [Undibacterium sp.]HTD06240.1 zonular occludens toxin domain-containing protein [Undibacterium sp.]